VNGCLRGVGLICEEDKGEGKRLGWKCVYGDAYWWQMGEKGKIVECRYCFLYTRN
jgi:hypothetical protein